jgi:hypothetical protein
MPFLDPQAPGLQEGGGTPVVFSGASIRTARSDNASSKECVPRERARPHGR